MDNRIRFGPFDFDPTTRELRRDGVPVHLQAQPAQVLALLLERAGEVVTRGELRDSIWGSDTFVDFDRGLNFCIAQIRTALSDSSSSPAYVKTLPKRGYQFIGIPSPAEVAQRSYKWLVVARVLAGLVLVALVWNALPSTPRIAIARFDNQTGDPEFDRVTDALTDAVVAEFTDWGGSKFAVIGNAAILRVPRKERDLLAIHKAVKADYVVLGEVQRSTAGVHVFAQLIGLPGQAHLKVTRIVSRESDPVKAQTELAQRILRDLSVKLAAGASK